MLLSILHTRPTQNCCNKWNFMLGRGVLAEFQELTFLPFDVYLKDDTDFFKWLKKPGIKMCDRYPATFLEITISFN